MKLTTNNLFVNRDTKHLKETDTQISFGSPYITQCVNITHEYSDHSKIVIWVDKHGLHIAFDYYGQYHANDIRELTWNEPIDFFEYHNKCNGNCGGCSEMYECHDLI